MIIVDLFEQHYCVTCIVPVARKFVVLLEDIKKADYFNFDRYSWKQRNTDDNNKWNNIYIKCKSRKEQEEVECDSGVRYSCLSELLCFNNVYSRSHA